MSAVDLGLALLDVLELIREIHELGEALRVCEERVDRVDADLVACAFSCDDLPELGRCVLYASPELRLALLELFGFPAM